MPHRYRSSDLNDHWVSRDWEAHLLSGLLRDSRITVLYGDPGAGKTTLLKEGVLPLLQRRLTDTLAPARPVRQNSVVIPFPDRRQRPRNAEMVVYFNEWQAKPLTALRNQLTLQMGPPPPGVHPRLVDLLDAWHRQHGTRFLLLLDGFEDCLRAAPKLPAMDSFVGQLIEVANAIELPVNVLVAIRSDAEPALTRMRQRIPSFDRYFLRLPHWRRGRLQPVPPSDASTSESNVSASSAPAALPPPPIPAPMPPPSAPPVADHGFVRLDLTGEDDPPANVEVNPYGASARAAAQRTAPKDGLPKWLGAAMLAALGATLCVIALLALQSDDLRLPTLAELPPAAQVPVPDARVRPVTGQPASPPAPEPVPPSAATAEVAPAPAPATATPSVPAPALPDTATAASVDPRLSAQLATLFPDSGTAAGRWPDGFRSLSGNPPLALARYDALQVARRSQPSNNPLQVVAPFLTEHVHVIVRADSPWRAMHQIEGQRLAIGAPGSPDAVTARALYQHLFNQPLAPAQTRTLPLNEALRALLVTRQVDAVILTAAHPSDGLAALDAATRRGIKLLAPDPKHPSTQRVTQRYLPTTAAGPTEQSLAVMSFLVTTRGANDAALRETVANLCLGLDTLRQTGHPAWRSVMPALALDVDLPYWPGAAGAWRACPR